MRKLTKLSLIFIAFVMFGCSENINPKEYKIAYLKDGNLWITSENGDRKIRLTEYKSIETFTWSPDGKSVIYGIAKTGYLEMYKISVPDNEKEYTSLKISEDKWDNECYYYGKLFLAKTGSKVKTAVFTDGYSKYGCEYDNVTIINSLTKQTHIIENWWDNKDKVDILEAKKSEVGEKLTKAIFHDEDELELFVKPIDGINNEKYQLTTTNDIYSDIGFTRRELGINFETSPNGRKVVYTVITSMGDFIYGPTFIVDTKGKNKVKLSDDTVMGKWLNNENYLFLNENGELQTIISDRNEKILIDDEVTEFVVNPKSL